MSALTFQLPDGRRQTVELSGAQPITVGRAEDNRAWINDGMVSRHHARLSVDADGRCIVEDLRSANGTTLNGAPLVQPQTVRDGDRLRFGEVTAVFLVADAEVARLPPLEPSAGETFAGRYRLESYLGETTEYHNFLAIDDLSASRRVSLKIFHRGVIAQAGGFARVEREFERVRAAPPHPNLIRLREIGRWRGAVSLAAEWIEGHPLLDVLRRRGALSVPETVRLTRQTAAATDHARAHGLLLPDLDLRATLVVFERPLSASDWERLFDQPVAGWPGFALKVCPRLLASDLAPRWPAGVQVCELLGRPAGTTDADRPARIAGLGEAGNAVLARGFATVGGAFGGDVAFIDALAQAAGAAPTDAAREGG